MKYPILLAGALAATTQLRAQNADDAVRYSFLNPTGTSRFSAMGGAFGALGADFSSISVDPGGLGIYKKSEISFTPSFYFQSADADFNGGGARDSNSNFNFGNAGMVFSWPN